MTYEESPHRGLNPGPYAYEAHALPLSYRGCWRTNLGMVGVWLKDYHVAGMLNIAQDHEWPSAAIPCGVAVAMVGATRRSESRARSRPCGTPTHMNPSTRSPPVNNPGPLFLVSGVSGGHDV